MEAVIRLFGLIFLIALLAVCAILTAHIRPVDAGLYPAGDCGLDCQLDLRRTEAAAVTPASQEELAVKTLRLAPWTTPQFVHPNEWRFYAIAAEAVSVNPIHPTVLMRILYLDRYNRLRRAWIPLEVQMGDYRYAVPRPGYERLAEVYIRGDFVRRSGVYWHECAERWCVFAQQVDEMVIQDGSDLGVSNGFIRYGVPPPEDYANGYLFWQAAEVH